jgi:LysM repeat protein
MTKTIPISFLAVTLMALTACGGEVVTVRPTTQASPTSASTPQEILEPILRPTATAPFLPPAPTATPTATPTPIVHVVQAGDTLGAIAFQYGVSMEAIQAANGIENPQFLSIAQELIIPALDEEGNTTPGLLLITPTPLPYTVQGVALYETPVGSLWCLGEVLNSTDFTLVNTQVHVALFDASGQQLIEANAFAAADVIPPGERAPFGVLFTTPPTGWVTPRATIMRGEAAGALADSYVPMTVVEPTGRPAEPQFQASGMVQNASAEKSAGGVSVTVTTYDAQGLVTGFRQRRLELDGPLAPNATAPFTVELNFHGAIPTDFHVIALGRVPSE